MAGDRRATMGNVIAQRDIEKVFPADEYSVVGIAGTAGLAVEMVRLFQVELEHFEKLEGHVLSLDGKANRLPEELSGGEQQRVAVARAFVNRPTLLIADEPTGNLDPTTSIDLMKLLDRINRTGTTVVMATHDSTVVDQMRKRVIELEDGRVVRDQARGVYGQTG